MPRLATVLGIAAAAAAGCSGPAQTAAAHPASRLSPAGRPCPARPGQTAITLTNTSPEPAVTVSLGARIVVTVPRWAWGTPTDVAVAGGILREQCTALLPGGGRRTVLVAVRPGSTWIGASVEPASDLAMPAWGGHVIVRTARA